MGLRAVKEYYLKCLAQYKDMLDNVADFDEALKAGTITQEQFDQAQSMLEYVKENYERLSYVMYLFSQPNRKEKVAKFNARNKLVINKFGELKATDTDVLKDNEDVLVAFKKMMGEIKN